MDELIKIRCPYCSTSLSVKRIPDIEKKSVTCPVCKRKSPFTNFKQIVYHDDPTDYTDTGQGQGWSPDPNTPGLDDVENNIIGQICVLRTGSTFPLKQGRNVIGRKADSSKATIQIPTGDNRRVSREHLVINVKRVLGQGFVHTVSLFKENVNKTFINGSQLQPGEELPLKHGCRIELPALSLRFEISDGEDTEGTDY